MSDYVRPVDVIVPDDAVIHAESTPVPRVRDQFASLRKRGDYIAIRDGGLPGELYTGVGYGQGSSEIHIQGIVRLKQGHGYLLSGGDPFEDGTSHMLFAEIGSLAALRPLGSNVRDARVPPAGDRVTAIYGLDSRLWHAGGIGILGDIVCVPLEGKHPGRPSPTARVGFFDVTYPMAPRRFGEDGWITCETDSAGAAAIVRLRGGHLLAAVWRDRKEELRETGGRLDFYVSSRPGWPSFDRLYGSWQYRREIAAARADPRYQGIGFVRERDTGQLYLIATANTSEAAPEFGEDFADLFLVSLPEGLAADPTYPVPAAGSGIRLHQLSHRRFEAADDWCDFAAGGGVSVSPEGLLCLYGAHHFRANGLFHATEFRADPPALPSGAYAWVDLFEHHDFAGRRLTIIGERDVAIPDYGKVGAQARSFANVASSVRYQLPDGWNYRLFREKGYRERPGETSTLTLVGNGRVEEIPDLKATVPRFGDCVMSSAYVSTPGFVVR